ETPGVLAVIVLVMTGVSGSSLVMTRVHDLGPADVGVKRITTSLQESWLTVAGKGLFTSTKSEQGGLKATLVTLRLHAPTLHTEMVFSARGPTQTSPKSVDPVTRMSPGGALPETATTWLGEIGSLLLTVMLAFLAPRLVGWKRIGTWMAPPGAMVSGKESVPAIWNSAEEEAIPVTERGQPPLLLMVRPRSLKEPTQTSPKFPLSAISVAMRCCTPLPVADTLRDGVPGSLDGMVSVAVFTPTLAGVKLTWNGKQKS